MTQQNENALRDIISGNNQEALALLNECDKPDSLEGLSELYSSICAKLGIESTAEEIKVLLLAMIDEQRRKTDAAISEIQKLDVEELDTVAGGSYDTEDEYGHDTKCWTLWHCLLATLHTESESHYVSCLADWNCYAFNN